MPTTTRQSRTFVRRGVLRSYVRPPTPNQVRSLVLLSRDGINDSPRPWLLGIELRDRDPGDVLAIPVGDGRWAYAGDLSRLYRDWVGDRQGTVDVTR